MFGKKTQINNRVNNGATEEALIAKVMDRLSVSPKAYEAIREALRGRRIADLTERELMKIINRAIVAAQ